MNMKILSKWLYGLLKFKQRTVIVPAGCELVVRDTYALADCNLIVMKDAKVRFETELVPRIGSYKIDGECK